MNIAHVHSVVQFLRGNVGLVAGISGSPMTWWHLKVCVVSLLLACEESPHQHSVQSVLWVHSRESVRLTVLCLLLALRPDLILATLNQNWSRKLLPTHHFLEVATSGQGDGRWRFSPSSHRQWEDNIADIEVDSAFPFRTMFWLEVIFCVSGLLP